MGVDNGVEMTMTEVKMWMTTMTTKCYEDSCEDMDNDGEDDHYEDSGEDMDNEGEDDHYEDSGEDMDNEGEDDHY